MNIILKQKINRFKKLNRRFKIEGDFSLLDELIKLEKYLVKNAKDWRAVYGRV
jgi:hypothetical protein